MKNRATHTFLFGILLLIGLYSCANQGRLSGGEKDETPPVLLAVSPETNSLNIKPTEIEFEFNENIKIKDLNKNLLVSPVLKYKPEIKQKPKSFRLIIKDTLLDNTTYTFNFGNAITDLNEGNELAGYRYVFSTGNDIDKGKLKGTVVDAKTTKLDDVESLWATLYFGLEDSLIRTTTPNYIAPINKETGQFQFENIAAKTYQLYIVKDNNFNKYFDLPNEKIAFSDTTYTITDTNFLTIEEDLALFEEASTKGIIKQKKSRRNNTFVIETNQNPNQFSFTDSLGVFDDYVKNVYKDSLLFFFTEENMSENLIYPSYKDSIIDTITVLPFNVEKIDSSFKIRLSGASDYRPNKMVSLETNSPIAGVNKDLITLLEDSLFVAGGVEFEPDSLLATKWNIIYPWIQGKEYNLTFEDSTFQSVIGLYSDSLTTVFKTPTVEELGTLVVKFQENRDTSSHVIFQLMNKDEVVEQRIIDKEQTLTIKELLPTSYTIQLIIDRNANGVWDTGLLERKIQPERIVKFTEPIRIRGNWDFEVDIIY